MKKIVYLALIASFPSLLLASGSIQESDFIQRVINFVIFVAILWYFAAGPIKGLFVNRRNAIMARLQEVQDNLHKAKRDKESAQKRSRASVIIFSAK